MENQGARHLTLKLVRQYLAEFGSVNLSHFTTIDEDAARALGNSSDAVFLDGLTALSVTAAQALAKCDGSAVSLNGLVTLADDVADKLINVKYNLCLNGLTFISDTVAERLAKFKGGYLSLNGLTTLSDRAASALAKRKGMDDAIFLQGLTSLTDQGVAELAKHNRLVLKGSIEVRVAQWRKGQRTPPAASQAAPPLQPTVKLPPPAVTLPPPTVKLPPPASLPGHPPGHKPDFVAEAMAAAHSNTKSTPKGTPVIPPAQTAAPTTPALPPPAPQQEKSMEDHCMCIKCGNLYELEFPVETGTVLRCEMCARNYKVGRWHGEHWKSGLLHLFSKRGCPQCDRDQGSNSTRGKQVVFGSPHRYLRQCNHCCATWIGT